MRSEAGTLYPACVPPARIASKRERAALAERDALVRWSRSLLYLGLFASSLISVRVGALTVGDLLLAASAGLLIFSSCRPWTGAGAGTARLIGLWLVLVGGTVAGYAATNAGEHMGVLVRIAYLVAVLPWQMRALLNTPERLLRGAWWFAGGAAAMGIGTLVQAQFGDVIGGGIKNGRYTGFAIHVSDAGGVAALAVAFGFAMYACRCTDRRTGPLSLLVLGGLGLALSGSVSGMLSVLAAAAFMLVTRRLQSRRLVSVAAVAFAALLVVGAIQSSTPGALTPWQRFLQTTGQQSFASSSTQLNTSYSRLDVLEAATRERLEQPLVGAGFDLESAIVRDSEFENQPHNILVGAFYRGGVLTLLGLLLILGSATRRALALPRRSTVNPAILAMFLTALAFAMTAPSLYSRYLWIPLAFVLVASVTEAKEPESRGKSQPHPEPPPTRRTRLPSTWGNAPPPRRRPRWR